MTLLLLLRPHNYTVTVITSTARDLAYSTDNQRLHWSHNGTPLHYAGMGRLHWSHAGSLLHYVAQGRVHFSIEEED